MTGYRERIFENFRSRFPEGVTDFDRRPSASWGRVYDTYLRGWLPTSRHAAIGDVACSAGRLLHFFAERGYTNVIGVDLSPRQLALARQETPKVCQEAVVSFLRDVLSRVCTVSARAG